MKLLDSISYFLPEKLWDAAAYGRLKEVPQIFLTAPSLKRIQNGKTMAHVAAMHGNFGQLPKGIQKQCLTWPDTGEQTVLFSAIAGGHLNTIPPEMLNISHLSLLNGKHENCYHPLTVSCTLPNLSTELLSPAGLGTKSRYGVMPIFEAINRKVINCIPAQVLTAKYTETKGKETCLLELRNDQEDTIMHTVPKTMSFHHF
jgi:hypothetical protein